MKKVMLFCLPYAGGSASMFYRWKNFISDKIDLYPCELSGRGTRITEPLYNSIEEAANDVFLKIKPNLKKNDFAFFGHSMGTVILYELLHILQKKGYKQPLISIFSGRNPPHIEIDEYTYNLSDSKLIEELRDIGGTSDEVLNLPEFIQIFLPIIRADYKITETYVFRKFDDLLNHNIAVFYGKDDEDVKISDVSQWSQYTNNKTMFYEFKGGHFFINEYIEETVNTINNLVLHLL